MKIPNEVINDIRNRAHIEDVISNYIQVMKKGNNYVAYCPFHDDHDPSLHISTDKQIWKCFSCPSEEGSAGDVFKFVMKYKHLDYVSAIKTVADMIGYKYDFGNENVNVFVESECHKVLRESVNFCQHELLSQNGIVYKEYLQKRNIDEDTINHFNIGYNPKNDALYQFLSKKGYKDQDIIKSNMARLTNNGIRDVFYDRIMIPICDVDGHPIGFTARSIDPNNESKYINTADTELFNKSNVLFNIHRAKEVIREKKYCIFVEGPMDVIAFDKAGMSNCVCSMGTSVTKQQLTLLKRFTPNLMLAFDGDKAGQGAILRTGHLALEAGFKIKVINNTTDLDPDEIIRQNGVQALKKMIDKPLSWLEFLFNYYLKQYDLNNYSAKKEFTNKMVEEINKSSDKLDKDNYFHRLADITGYSYSVLTSVESQNINKSEENISSNALSLDSGIEIAQKTIINQVIQSKTFVNAYKEELGELPSPNYNELMNLIINQYLNNEEIEISSFAGEIDSQLSSILFSIVEDPILIKEVNKKVFSDALKKIKRFNLQQEVKAKKAQMDTVSDPVLKTRILNQVVQLQKNIQELLNDSNNKEK